jgi:hypothetical protein
MLEASNGLRQMPTLVRSFPLQYMSVNAAASTPSGIGSQIRCGASNT